MSKKLKTPEEIRVEIVRIQIGEDDGELQAEKIIALLTSWKIEIDKKKT